MTKDLYAILGIRRNASQKAIKSAFRRKSKKCHPDMGGSIEEFQEVKLACSVLSDPQRKARYDETGQYEDSAPKQTAGPMMSLLFPIFLQTVQSIIDSQRDPGKEDVRQRMIQGVAAMQQQIDGQRQKLSANMAKWETVKGRFTVEDSENFLDAAVAAHVGRMKEQLQPLDEQSEALKEAMALLKKCKYRMDASTFGESIFGGGTARVNGQWTTYNGQLLEELFRAQPKG